ncbi:MAG: TetR-like C-terminal domain-containing protein [Bifidobacteriaceae bacterium]|nr:TetR-like C-terminal domain-containing protein [Bifidobacteriaceae bacterium]
MSDLAKRALAQSLVTLLQTTPVNRITVGDLTDMCGVSRSTFYYHYHDIYELVEQVAYARFGKVLGENRGKDSWPEGLRSLMEELKRDQAFIVNVYAGINHDKLRTYLVDTTEGLLYDVAHEELESQGVADGVLHEISRSYSYIFVETVMEWVEDGMRRSIDAIVDALSATLCGCFAHSLAQWKARGLA